MNNVQVREQNAEPQLQKVLQQVYPNGDRNRYNCKVEDVFAVFENGGCVQTLWVKVCLREVGVRCLVACNPNYE